MKKYVVLVLISITLILIVFAVGYTRVEGTDLVKGVRIDPSTAVERVNYSGTVEYADSASASAKGSGVVQTVFFKNGDHVDEGDVVLSVCETYADISGSDIMSRLTANSADALTSLIGADPTVTFYSAGRSGVISGLDVESGGFFTKGQTLFKVSEQEGFQVQLNVSEKDISKVEPGQDVRIDCKALSHLLGGTVQSVGDTAKQTATSSGKITTVRVTVKINDSADGLKTGYTADCSIVTDRKDGALLAPYSAVGYDDGGAAYVYLKSGSAVKKQPVSVGKEYSNGIEITKGISDGDIIVYDAAKVSDPARTVVNEVTVG